METKEEWKSRVGFLMAAIGSAIGLGNIWRFSYLCYKNGGGAFLIPYLVALFTAGIPLLILEYGIGHRFRGSAVLSFRKIGKKWEWIGWWPSIFAVLGIAFYYTVILAWCLDYIWYSLTLKWGSNPSAFFFHQHLNLSKGFWNLGHPSTIIFTALIVIWILNWFIELRGIQRGIELACKIFIPLLVVLITILVIRGVTLPGSGKGIAWYLKPDFSHLTNPRVWLDAYGQIFFSLSIAMATMIAYASYLPKKADVTGNALITAFANSGFSLFAGFAVFSTLGFISVQQNLPPSEVVKSGFGLAFVAYPQAISAMPFGARAFGVIFFTALVIAGLSSSISMIEGLVASLIDKFQWKRRRIIHVITLLGLLVGVVYTTGSGYYFLDLIDHFISSYSLILVGLFEAVVVGWVYKASNLREEINQISNIKIGRWWDFMIKYFIPIVLTVIFVFSLKADFVQKYGNYPLAAILFVGIGSVVVTFIIGFFFYKSKWKKSGELLH
ncbi:sodium:neurotransmitter symporter family protein [bacterium BMS3Abin05]|nr:sodium:neurotransmitter symporter family protein [bacterium BMS3Abin05]GBE27233.1 sodium:neurotransmitter symporter family protein [bacterium BMS3Bbin03]HDZ12183.1 sodium-dependent transporter [Bacteroidota bacterium]